MATLKEGFVALFSQDHSTFHLTLSNLVLSAVQGGMSTSTAPSRLEEVNEPGRLSNHEADVNSVGFFSDGSRMVSISDDRTFNIWDMSTLVSLYRSSIVSAGCLVNIAFDHVDCFSIATSNGEILRVNHTDNEYRITEKVDLQRKMVKLMSLEDSLNCSSVQRELYDMKLCYVTQQTEGNCESWLKRESTIIRKIHAQRVYLLVSTANQILLLDGRTMGVLEKRSLNDILPPSLQTECSSYSANAEFPRTICQSDRTMFICKPSASDTVVLCELIVGCEEEIEGQSPSVSVLATAPLLDTSPLKKQLVLAEEKKPTRQSLTKRQIPGTVKNGRIVDNQEITFRKNVKSSGYSKTSEKPKLFQPQLNRKLTPKKHSTTKLQSLIEVQYPTNEKFPTQPTDKQLQLPQSPVTCLGWAPRGGTTAYSHYDGSVSVVKGSTVRSFVAHNGKLNTIRWSNSSTHFLTASDDCTARLWRCDQSEPVMTVNYVKHNHFAADQASDKAAAKSENAKFTRSVTDAQFYFLDRFVLLIAGDALHTYAYQFIDAAADTKRYKTPCRYKLAHRLPLENCQTVTCLSAVNHFNSYTALVGGSNRTVSVVDMNEAKVVRTYLEAHSRAPYGIAQNDGSMYSSLPPGAYNLFCTAAMGDAVKLWDARTERPVQKYQGHRTGGYPCALRMSPCGVYTAIGSEDNSVYVYDVRVTGSYVHKIGVLAATVTALDFNPKTPLLTVGTLDGKTCSFKSKLGNS